MLWNGISILLMHHIVIIFGFEFFQGPSRLLPVPFFFRYLMSMSISSRMGMSGRIINTAGMLFLRLDTSQIFITVLVIVIFF